MVRYEGDRTPPSNDAVIMTIIITHLLGLLWCGFFLFFFIKTGLGIILILIMISLIVNAISLIKEIRNE